MRKLVIAFMAVFTFLYMNPMDGYCATQSVDGLSSIGTQTVTYNTTMNEKEYTVVEEYTYYNGVCYDGVIANVADAIYTFNIDNSAYPDYYSYLGNPQPLTYIAIGNTNTLAVSYECHKRTYFNGNVVNDTYNYGTLGYTAAGSTSDLISTYENDSDSALREYAEQFLYDDSTYEDFIEYFKSGNGAGKVLVAIPTHVTFKESRPSASFSNGCPTFDLISGLIPAEEHTGLYSNFDNGTYGNCGMALPYLFVSPNDEDGLPDNPTFSDDDSDSSNGNAKDFICYREHKKPYASLSTSRVASSIFTWVVEDYPEFADCFIEVRSTLLEGNDLTGYKPLTDDYYYYASIDSNNKKESQENLASVPFSSGSFTCYERDMGNYFLSFDGFKAIATSCPIRMQVRVISEDKSIFSNWVTFDFDLSGQNVQTAIEDDDGKTVIDGIDNAPGYEWELDNNSGKYGYALDNEIEDWDADFHDYLNNALSDIMGFPELINRIYGWLPNSIVNLIAISIGLLICLRILGR